MTDMDMTRRWSAEVSAHKHLRRGADDDVGEVTSGGTYAYSVQAHLDHTWYHPPVLVRLIGRALLNFGRARFASGRALSKAHS